MPVPWLPISIAAASALPLLFGGGGDDQPDVGTIGPLPESQLPGVGQSLALMESLRGKGFDIFGRPITPSKELEALRPMLDARLAQIQEAGRLTKGTLAGQAEERGLTFSDIALGQIGGVDVGMMQAEQGLEAELLQRALGERARRESGELGFIGSQIGIAEQMARAREDADLRRAIAARQATTAQQAWQSQAASQQASDWMKLASSGMGLAAYLYGQQPQGAAPVQPSGPAGGYYGNVQPGSTYGDWRNLGY